MVAQMEAKQDLEREELASERATSGTGAAAERRLANERSLKRNHAAQMTSLKQRMAIARALFKVEVTEKHESLSRYFRNTRAQLQLRHEQQRRHPRPDGVSAASLPTTRPSTQPHGTCPRSTPAGEHSSH